MTLQPQGTPLSALGTAQLPRVSVIIPVYNNQRALALTLDALACQSYPHELVEVIVVDNGSDEDLTRHAGTHPHVIFLREPVPGSYTARNRGIRQAAGEVLAFTDSDCVPLPGWLEAGVLALRGDAHIGLVAGSVQTTYRDPHRPSIIELYDDLSGLAQDEALATARFAATANLFTTRRVMDEVGWFDARLLSGGDRDWGNRVNAAGLLQVYAADALVLHPARHTLRALVNRSLRVTVATRVAGPDANLSWGYARRHLLERPIRIWRRLREAPETVSYSRALAVMGLYFGLKTLQALERLRARFGPARR